MFLFLFSDENRMDVDLPSPPKFVRKDKIKSKARNSKDYNFLLYIIYSYLLN
jgi:hypothetical protein